MKVGRKPKYPEKTPNDELQNIPHIKARIFKPQPRLEPALYAGTCLESRHANIYATRLSKEKMMIMVGEEADSEGKGGKEVCLFVGCLTSHQQASVSQGRICSDHFTCCHTEIEVADQTFYLTQSQYTDTGPTSSSADPITPGAWQGSYCIPILRHWYDSTRKKSRRKRNSNP